VAFPVSRSDVPLMFVTLPLVGWAAWRFQQRGAAPAALLVAGIASWAAANGAGPFGDGTLFERMLSLQAFNATVAFSSLFFAAVVTERMRARSAVERAAAELEDRVRARTSELSVANEQLRREVQEREAAEKRLLERERQLAEAQEVAQMGSFEWVISADRVSWSDEMFRIHGFQPQEFPVTFDKAVELVVEEDLDRIRRRVQAALAARGDHLLPEIEYRIVRPDGAERMLLGRAWLAVGESGEPFRMVGTVQDVTESKQAEREHRIAETLQRSLLPDRLPDIPGVMLAARYVPATADVEVGGDWYDVVPLPNGHVALAIGDVAGHGLRAASIMGQLRMALRAYALEDAAPAAVIRRAHELVHRLLPTEMTTLIYLVFDPDSGIVRFANAGHPPPLVVGTAGAVRFVEEGLAPPLGTVPHPDHYREESFVLAGGATLLLFTDGLIERRGVSIQDGLTRLRDEVAGFDRDLDALCDHLLETMVGGETSDDVAMLALRPAPFAGRPLQLRLQAEPAALAPLRQTLRRWLREAGAERDVAEEILVAVGEACANVIRHAYGAREGPLEVGLGVEDGDVTVTIGDIGAWRPPSEAGGGRGLPMMRGFMDSVATEIGAAGTVVRMRRRLTGGPIREQAREHDDPFGHGGTGP
jgi:PAS domain S-box-containing protein